MRDKVSKTIECYHKLARLGGLEPPTLGSEGRCSVQLSYRRTESRRGAPKKLGRAEGLEPSTTRTTT